MTDLTQLIDGSSLLPYIIVLVWTFVEGESIVILAGVAAHDNTPFLPGIILAAFCGSLCGDQLAFFLGRWKGRAFVARRPWLQARAAKVYPILEKHQNWLIFGFRFLYGVRNITPFTLGMSGVRTRRFVILNVMGAAVWATTFAFAGYLFGNAAVLVFKSHKTTVLGVLLGVLLVYWIVRIIFARRRRAREKAAAGANEQAPAQKLLP